MKKFSFSYVALDVRLGLMHADHEREFAKADRSGEERICYEQREGGAGNE